MDLTDPMPEVIGILATLLRGELAAVETYGQVIAMIKDETIPELEENRSNHIARIPMLSARIKALGGAPISSSGAWGAFARLVEGGAKLFGRGAALAALEEGEEHGLIDYNHATARLDAVSRAVVENVLLPAQERSHRLLSTLAAKQQHVAED